MRIIIFINILFSITLQSCTSHNQPNPECLIVATVLDNLEEIFFPSMEEFKDRVIDNFIFSGEYNGVDGRIFESIMDKRDSSLLQLDIPLGEKVQIIDCLKLESEKNFEVTFLDPETVVDYEVILVSKPIILDERAYLEVVYIRDKKFSSSHVLMLTGINDKWKIIKKKQSSIG